MGPPKFGAPGNCPICPPLKPALIIYIYIYTVKPLYKKPLYKKNLFIRKLFTHLVGIQPFPH